MNDERNNFSDENREINYNESDTSVKHKYELSVALRDKLKDYPDVIEFIEKLQKYIDKQKRKLKKLRQKLKKTSTKDASTQTGPISEEPFAEASKENQAPEGKTKSFAEDIKDAAEQAMLNSGFVYEATSGMYYDYNTGYYYNAEYGLYYDGNTGTYLSYNQDTQSYEYHSQVVAKSDKEPQITYESEAKIQPNQNSVKKRRKKNNNTRTKDNKRQKEDETTPDLEEGECSDSCSTQSVESSDSEVGKQWPPCMRIIVEETSIPKVKVGSLHIITYEGGSLGREGAHSLVIPDINISKHHLKFTFDKESGKFLVTDMGSRNGTILNGKRMSSSKQESEALEVVHGSKIQLGSTVLLCHIHDGSQTCGLCEPGLLQNTAATCESKCVKMSKSERHKNELKNLRKKFGVSSYEDDNTKLASGYTDRAQKRRETVGSQNPHEKTQMASLDESIKSENKGFKMLSKMGWKEGQSLGKEGQGVLEPVKLVSNQGTTGIGCEAPLQETIVNENKQQMWKKAQERFQKLPNAPDAFENSD